MCSMCDVLKEVRRHSQRCDCGRWLDWKCPDCGLWWCKACDWLDIAVRGAVAEGRMTRCFFCGSGL